MMGAPVGKNHLFQVSRSYLAVSVHWHGLSPLKNPGFLDEFEETIRLNSQQRKPRQKFTRRSKKSEDVSQRNQHCLEQNGGDR
jgi:hypothetical protein